MNWLKRFRAWKKKRYWARRHFDFVMAMVREDARWLASEPVANILTERYESAIAADWYSGYFDDVRVLRDRIRNALALEIGDSK